MCSVAYCPEYYAKTPHLRLQPRARDSSRPQPGSHIITTSSESAFDYEDDAVDMSCERGAARSTELTCRVHFAYTFDANLDPCLFFLPGRGKPHQFPCVPREPRATSRTTSRLHTWRRQARIQSSHSQLVPLPTRRLRPASSLDHLGHSRRDNSNTARKRYHAVLSVSPIEKTYKTR